MKEELKWYIVNTYINKKGASVSCLCYQPNNWGTYWSSNLKDENMTFYDTEKEALEHARNFGSSVSVHGMYIEV